MMTTYVYLRVSTDEQDVDNQHHGLFLYANIHGLGPLQFVEDTASGRLAWRDRAVGGLLMQTAHAGDAVYRGDRGTPRVLPQDQIERYYEVIAAMQLRTANKQGRHLTGRLHPSRTQDLQQELLAAGLPL